MSAMISVLFVREASFRRMSKTPPSGVVHLTMNATPEGGYGGDVAIHLNSAEQAQMIIDAFTEARDSLTGATP